MGGAALASILHVSGRPLPSHCCRPIVVVQSPSSYCRPLNAAVIIIDIVSVGSSSGIITIAITVAVFAAVSAIAVIAVIVDVASMMLLCHCCIVVLFWRPIGEAGPNHSSPNCPHWCAALASVLHVAATHHHHIIVVPSLYHCCPIVVVKLPLSNCHPQIAAVVVIDIFAVGSGSGIIAIAVAVAVAVSPIAIVAVIVNVASSTLLRHYC
jgi:hypothetical protein